MRAARCCSCRLRGVTLGARSRVYDEPRNDLHCLLQVFSDFDNQIEHAKVHPKAKLRFMFDLRLQKLSLLVPSLPVLEKTVPFFCAAILFTSTTSPFCRDAISSRVDLVTFLAKTMH